MIDQVLVAPQGQTSSESGWGSHYRFQNLSEDEQATNLLYSFLIGYKKDLDDYKQFLISQNAIIQSYANRKGDL